MTKFDPDEVTEAINLETLLNSMTFIPKDNKLFSFWNFLISVISLVQTIMYAVFVGWGFHHDFLNWRNIVLCCIEFLYLVNIFVQMFIAYDIEGDSVYEYRFEKTAKRFTKSQSFWIQIFVWIPWGLLGNISESHHILRILWLVKF